MAKNKDKNKKGQPNENNPYLRKKLAMTTNKGQESLSFQSKEMTIAMQVKGLLLQHNLSIDEAALVIDYLHNRILWNARNSANRNGHNNFS